MEIKGERIMKYNGQELIPITEPQIFNPPKEMLVWDSIHQRVRIELVYAITSRKSHAVIAVDSCYDYCAEIPEEPKPTRATYIQLIEWLAKGKGVYRFAENATIRMDISVAYGLENMALAPDMQIRPFGTDKWVEPTLDNMGMEDK